MALGCLFLALKRAVGCKHDRLNFNCKIMNIQAKNSIDVEGCSKVEKGISDEMQRAWNDQKWEQKENEYLHNYDQSRSHLNFEITKGGIIRPIDKSMTVQEKIDRNLESRGIANPNNRANVRREQRICANIIIGGSGERLRLMAFGSPEELKKGEDHSDLERQKEIELYAKDVYNFMARHFGEENIAYFYMHLDEKSPHIHCGIIPVDKEKNKVSWKTTFHGYSAADYAKFMRQLHTDLANEVGERWGLERGDDIRVTGAKHVSAEEYRDNLRKDIQSLQQEIRRAEIKLKGLHTMLSNLENEKADIERQIEELKDRAEKTGEEQEENILRLKAQLDAIDVKIHNRQEQIDDCNKKLLYARQELSLSYSEKAHTENKNEELEDTNKSLEKENANLRTQNRELIQANQALGDDVAAKYEQLMDRAISETYQDCMNELMQTTTPQQDSLLDKFGVTAMAESSDDIFTTGLFILAGMADAATNHVATRGGYAGGNNQIPKKKEDEDDVAFAKRAFLAAAKMFPPQRRRKLKR